MKQDTIYGVRVSPVFHAKIETLSVHPFNVKRTEPDQDDWMIFSRDVKEHGVQVPILLTAENKIIQGQRRFRAAKKAGLETVPARHIEPNIEHNLLLKLIYRDNQTRRGYSDEELELIVVTNWDRERITSILPRGITRYKSSLEPLERLLPEITGISVSRAKKILSSVRSKLKAQKAGVELEDGEMRFGLNRAREYVKIRRQIIKIEEQIERVKVKQLAPLQKQLTQIEGDKDLRKIGGIRAFLKLLEGG